MDWLPPLLGFSGNWDEYEHALYEAFCADWIFGPPPTVRNQRVTIEKSPLFKGKEQAFWHLTSEGRVEEERVPNLRRCERISWPRAILEAIDTERTVCWENERKGARSLVVALPDYSYIVAMRQRNGYFLLRSAYPIESNRRRENQRKEHEAFLRSLDRRP